MQIGNYIYIFFRNTSESFMQCIDQNLMILGMPFSKKMLTALPLVCWISWIFHWPCNHPRDMGDPFHCETMLSTKQWTHLCLAIDLWNVNEFISATTYESYQIFRCFTWLKTNTFYFISELTHLCRTRQNTHPWLKLSTAKFSNRLAFQQTTIFWFCSFHSETWVYTDCCFGPYKMISTPVFLFFPLMLTRICLTYPWS